MGWSAGFTYQLPEGSKDVVLGDFTTFTSAIRALHTYAVKMQEGGEECETLIADIDDIRKDPGIMDDSDQWEDMDFPTDREDNLNLWIFED